MCLSVSLGAADRNRSNLIAYTEWQQVQHNHTNISASSSSLLYSSLSISAFCVAISPHRSYIRMFYCLLFMCVCAVISEKAPNTKQCYDVQAICKHQKKRGAIKPTEMMMMITIVSRPIAQTCGAIVKCTLHNAVYNAELGVSRIAAAWSVCVECI